jgi:hypothetical protein
MNRVRAQTRRYAVVAVPAVGVGLAVTALVALTSVDAEAGITTPGPRPPVPQVVSSDGTMNMSYFKGVRMWAPPGRLGRLVRPADFESPRLTPARIAALTPAQRVAAHIVVTP